MARTFRLMMPHVLGVSMADRIRLGGQRSDDDEHQIRVCILVGLCGALAPGRHCDVCVGFWEVIWMSILIRAL